MSGAWNKHMSYRSDDSAIGTKDGDYCGNDLSQKRLLHQFKDIAVVRLTLLRTISRAL